MHFLGDTRTHRLWRLQGGHAFLEQLEVGAAVVLGQAKFLLDDFQLLAQEELSLLLGDFLIHLAGDAGLHFGHFALLAQQQQYLLHAGQQGKRVEDFLQLVTLGRGERGREVRQQAGLVGAEVCHVVFQLFAVQRIERQQLFDLLDQGHRVGFHFIAVAISRTARVFDLDPVGRGVGKPAQDAKALHALHQELTGAGGAGGPVQTRHAADFGKLAGPHAVRALLVDIAQAHQSVALRGNRLQRRGPFLRIDRDRLYLSGKERSLRHRNHIQRIRENIVGHRRGPVARRVSVVLVLGKLLGLAHGCLCPMLWVSGRYGRAGAYFKRLAPQHFSVAGARSILGG